MRTIGFLHTSPVHTPVFEALVRAVAPDVRSQTRVDEHLLALARAEGLDDATLLAGVAAHLDELRRSGADLVVCTCSTIGAMAEAVGAEAGLNVVRVDRPMAERAVASGGRIHVLAALESTLTPTVELLESVAHGRGAEVSITVELIDGAWERFECGDLDGYLRSVAEAIAQAEHRADVVVLAQASMAPAAELVRVAIDVLASPWIAVETLLR